MTFSQYAGTAIVPTLARLVLAAAFISAGYNKVIKTAEFDEQEAQQLRALGVEPEPSQPVQASAALWTGGDAVIRLASYRVQSEGAAPGALRNPSTGPGQDAPAQQPPADPEPDPGPPQPVREDEPQQPEVDPPPATEPAAGGAAPPASTAPLRSADGKYRSRAVHKLALILEAHNFPEPVWLAWIAALTELVGGAMLLIGLFSRIWGLGLAIAMGVAFYIVSMKVHNVHTTHPFTFAENIPAFNTLYAQLGLFVLAFGIFLTGPGPLSIDRMLFGGTSGDGDDGEPKID